MATTSVRKPLYFTFGNHMHWVDMEWLWGYGVLPDSVRDMLALVAATGARGNINFDGIGYEKIAVEAPDALAELREAVHDGRIEVTGASYGQPYGLFHGGESNVRQRVFGVRAVMRLLGTRPCTFWEEEFDFFPQLPQILAGTGFTGASLFFQWTWHTPVIPEERTPLVRWEGVDGTQLPALAKTALCLHQWPEDLEGRLDSALVAELDEPVLVQWLELMPSPDWMCRSEVLLGRLRELFADARFELRPRTLGNLLVELDDGTAPVRRYTMDEVFHGVSLGKNGDRMPRWSHRCEERVLLAESLATVTGLCGRPYPSWDVYPTWELDEAWRELLSAQHHDNHECEGLCGFVGATSFERSAALSGQVTQRAVAMLARRTRAPDDSDDALLVYNQLGWPRDIAVEGAAGAPGTVARHVPAHGWVVLGRDREPGALIRARETGDLIRLERETLSVDVCPRTGRIVQLASAECPDGAIADGAALGAITVQHDGRTVGLDAPEVALHERAGREPVVVVAGEHAIGRVSLEIELHPVLPAMSMQVRIEHHTRPDPGMHAGAQLQLANTLGNGGVLLHDTPYCVDEVVADRDDGFCRKYPSGDWMTSEQWFETVRRPFTSLSMVDLQRARDDPRAILVLHDGSQAWFRTEDGVRCLLDMYDPWDEDHYEGRVTARFAFIAHRGMRHAQRFRLAQEHRAVTVTRALQHGGAPKDLPAAFCGLHVDAPNVAVTAFHRESRRAAELLANAFHPSVRNPFVVRLVELDGEGADVTLRLPGPVARAARTDLMGELRGAAELRASPCAPPPGGADIEWHALSFAMRPREIATVMLDLELGRHVPRNLDAHRHVWARVHRKQEAEASRRPK